jgi:hypothetical protein
LLQPINRLKESVSSARLLVTEFLNAQHSKRQQLKNDEYGSRNRNAVLVVSTLDTPSKNASQQGNVAWKSVIEIIISFSIIQDNNQHQISTRLSSAAEVSSISW